MKKTLSLFLATIMLVICLVGCTPKEVLVPDYALTLDEVSALLEEKVEMTENDKIIVAEYDGNKLNLAEFRTQYLDLSDKYLYYYGFNWKSDDELVKSFNEELEFNLKYNYALLKTVYDAGVFFTDQDIYFAFEQYDALKEMYGEEPDVVINNYSYHTPHSFLMFVAYNSIYINLYENMYNPGGYKYEEMKKATLDYFAENDIIRAKHILIKFPSTDSELTEEQKAESFAKAEEVIEKINDGNDFDKLISTYNEDLGMPASGYYFGKNEMVIEFETAAYALEEGAVSGIVETPYGYHIIKRLPLDDDNIVESSIYQTLAYEDYTEAITANLEKVKVVKRKDYDTLIAPVQKEAEDYLNEIKSMYGQAENEDNEQESTQETAE